MAGLDLLPRLRSVLEAAAWELGRLARRVLRSWGLVGLLAALLGVLAIGLGWWSGDLERQSALLRQRLDKVAAHRMAPTPPGAGDPEAGFRARLVSHDDIPVVVQDLLAVARRHQLQVLQADYRAEADDVGGFVRYRIALPVKGVGANLQTFMSEALQEQPALALEALQLRRDTALTRQVEARLHWVLFAALPPSGALQARGVRKP